MNIRGLQFPAFTLKWPTQRDQAFVLKYVERDGKQFRVLLDIRAWHYEREAYSIGIPRRTGVILSSIAGRAYRTPDELPERYKHMTIHSIFAEKNEGAIRES